MNDGTFSKVLAREEKATTTTIQELTKSSGPERGGCSPSTFSQIDSDTLFSVLAAVNYLFCIAAS